MKDESVFLYYELL